MADIGWRYYNHALIPTCAPHETPDIEALNNKELWKKNRPLLARWTSDWDRAKETEWWYCICDKPFDISALKSKRRNVIKNALKYCTVSVCDPMEYEDDLLTVFNKAQLTYPAANRRVAEKAAFHDHLERMRADGGVRFFLCFMKESGAVVGYAVVKENGTHGDYQSQKVCPEFESYQANAALAYAILEHYTDRLRDGFYICDGTRNINHATNFQAYLEKYFGFRKAYCNLHIRYRKGVKPLVSALYHFRGAFGRWDGNKFVHKINAVLRMEEMRRKCNE